MGDFQNSFCFHFFEKFVSKNKKSVSKFVAEEMDTKV